MPKKKKASVRSIAEACGVSTATVSRVFNNDPHVSEETKQLVLDTASKAGYVFAGKEEASVPKRKDRRPKIGIITQSIHQEYYVNLTLRITEYLETFGIDVLTASFDRKKEKLPGTLELLYSSDVDGVILISCDYLSIKEHLSSTVSHVWIDCNDAPEKSLDICTVQSDQFTGGQLAALELIAKGCKAPLLLTSSSDSIRSQSRCRGFFQEFSKAGIELDQEERTKFMPLIKNVFEESRELIRYLIAKGYEFDSVFAISDWRALGVYSAVQSMNRKVPDDIRIIGFDGISLACRSVLRITSIQQNTRLLAQNACDMLMKLMQGEEIPEKHVIIPVDVMEGQTT